MSRFRDGIIQILIATDVAARGLDVNNLSHVINYSLLMILRFTLTEVVEQEEREIKKEFL